MKSEKSGNSRTKPETRGRKPLKNPSIQVSWRIKHDIYQLLLNEQKRIEKEMGSKPDLSRVLEGLVKKHLS